MRIIEALKDTGKATRKGMEQGSYLFIQGACFHIGYVNNSKKGFGTSIYCGIDVVKDDWVSVTSSGTHN